MASFQPSGQKEPSGPHMGHHVDLPGLRPVRFCGGDAAAQVHAGVGEPDVDVAELLDRLGVQRREALFGGRVAGEDRSTSLRADCCRRVSVEVVDHDVNAFAGEPHR